MVRQEHWTCDLCGTAVVDERRPPSWHRLTLAVTTDKPGQWAHEFAGDVCEACFNHVNQGARALTSLLVRGVVRAFREHGANPQ
jgi:hypothetical protein